MFVSSFIKNLTATVKTTYLISFREMAHYGNLKDFWVIHPLNVHIEGNSFSKLEVYVPSNTYNDNTTLAHYFLSVWERIYLWHVYRDKILKIRYIKNKNIHAYSRVLSKIEKQKEKNLRKSLMRTIFRDIKDFIYHFNDPINKSTQQ